MTDQVVEKIRKLLAKADGTENEHEAAAFAAKARELLEQHNISEMDERLKLGLSPDPVVERRLDLYHRGWEYLLYDASAHLYFCALYKHRFVYEARGGKRYLVSGITVYGRAHNVEVAVSMAEYLHSTVVRLSDAQPSAERVRYREGLADGLWRRTRKMREEALRAAAPDAGQSKSRALVLVDVEAEALGHHASKVGLKPGRNIMVGDKSSDAFGRGRRDAADVNLGGQVNQVRRRAIA